MLIRLTLRSLALVRGLALADNAVMEELGSRAAVEAMEQLKFGKGDENVLALTNAGHAIIDGVTTQAAIKGLTEESGNSVGDANLFQVLRPYWKPVWFYFFNKATGEAVFMQADSKVLNKSLDEFKALPSEEVFSKVSKANVDLNYMLNHTDEGNATFAGAFNGNEFALVGMSNVWADGGSFDLEMMPYWNQPEVFVSTIKGFSVDASKLAQLQNAGMHPLRLLEYCKEKK